MYRGADWFVLDLQAAHVDREQWTVKFAPTLVSSFAITLANVVVDVCYAFLDPRVRLE